jgi:hypothetical protein
MHWDLRGDECRRGNPMFLLTKWYLDVVSAEGTALIAYAARLRWGRVRLAYASVLVSEASRPARETRAFGAGGLWPRLDGDRLTWAHPRLGIDGTWDRETPAIRRRLLKSDDGEIRWACEMPCARASVTVGDRTFEGLGYAERLSLSIPPWKLPFRTLRWGRHTSTEHSLVWIDWAGDDTRRHVWLDGVEQPDACLRSDGRAVSRLDRETTLRLDAARDICDQRALGRIAGRVPGLTRRLAGPVAAMREHKQIARGTIERQGDADRAGWTLFETVTW